MNKFSKIIKSMLIPISLSSLFTLVSCNKNKDDNQFFHIESNDEDFANFMNEYYLRHVREMSLEPGTSSNWACNDLELGYGSLYMKEWEMRSLSWMDTSHLSGDRLGKLKYYLRDFPIDKFGYMWSCSDTLEASGYLRTANNAFGQGWPIPYYGQSKGLTVGYEFNDDCGWTSNGNCSVISQGLLTSKLKGDNLWFLSPDLSLNTYYTPYISTELRINDLENYEAYDDIDDIYLMWQTIEGGNTWFEVSQKEWCTIPTEHFTSFFGHKMFFPMYLNENWGLDKTVTKVKVEIRTKDHKKVSLQADMNFFRIDFDTRQSNNSTIFLCYANEYFKYNNDVALMEELLTKFRKITQFLLDHLNGRDGLIDISYFIGHDGIGQTIGHGIGNGYWDIFTPPEINSDANIYFYKALLAMAEIEEKAKSYNINIPLTDATVVGKDGFSTSTYNETSESLRSIAEKCKRKFQSYFWNEETGRFHYGIVNDRILDYGYVAFNLEAITAGLASNEQEQSIMSWINGDRIVESDLENGEQNGSTGEDIYFYDFGPRSTTKKNWTDYSITWPNGNLPFGLQVQDGGAIMYVSFYDLYSRTKVLGIENSFKRMKEINAWYDEVKSYGGEGDTFYLSYYASAMPDIGLQGGGSVGAVGLDFEFLENCMVYDYLSECLLDLKVSKAYQLSITPNLPSELEYVTFKNLYYDGIVYDLKVTHDQVSMMNVRGNAEGRTVLINLNGKQKEYSFEKFSMK